MYTGIVGRIIEALNPSHNNQTMPLAAIWLKTKLQTGSGPKRRITEGDFVHVDKDGQLQDCSKEMPVNYRITGCYGTINNTDLHFVAINIKTLELIRIDV